MVNKIIIKKLSLYSPKTYFQEIVEIHKKTIDSGFLPTLNTNFLKLLYYCFTTSPHSFIYCALDNNKIVGFIVGSINTSMVYKYFIKKYLLQSLFYLFPFIFSLKLLFKIIEIFKYPNNCKHFKLPTSEILNFCVDENYQGKGIGKILFKYLNDEFLQRNINKIKIVTGSNQISAQKFYEKLGAIKVTNIEIHKGIISYIYTLDLKKE